MIDGLPPHDHEGEQGVLGCSLLDPSKLDDAREFGVEEAWFYDLRHQTLWTTLCRCADNGTGMDLIAFGGALKREGCLEGVGGLAYISDIMGAVPSPENLHYYLPMVRDKFRLRKLLTAATEIIQAVREKPEDTETAIAEAETAILGVRGEFGDRSDTTARKVARQAVDDVQERISGSAHGLPVGWRMLDWVTRGGFRAGEMIVIAGRPATGKTSLAMTMTRLIAGRGVPVGVISLEMSGRELGARFLAQESRFSWDQFDQRRQPSAQEFHRMTTAAATFGQMPIVIFEGSSISVGGIAAKARRWVRSHGIKLLVIDYLQLVSGNPKIQRREQVDEISGGIKRLAKELALPVIALAQLSRDIEKDKDRKPRLSDLRESGAIEQDADFVGMLYRAGKATEFEDDPDMVEVNLHVAKFRRGTSQIDVPFMFHKSLTEFTPIEKEKPE